MPHDHVTLLGAEDVTRAASTMRSAAETMQQAAWSISEALSRNQQFMDDWLMRLESIVTEARRPVEYIVAADDLTMSIDTSPQIINTAEKDSGANTF